MNAFTTTFLIRLWYTTVLLVWPPAGVGMVWYNPLTKTDRTIKVADSFELSGA